MPRTEAFALGLIILAFLVLGVPFAQAEQSQEKYQDIEVLLVANSKVGTISVIDAKDHEKLCCINVIPDIEERRQDWSIPHRFVNWYAGTIYADDLAVSPDGKILYVSRGSLSDVAAFDLESGALLWRVPVERYRADHMALSPDGKRIFISAIISKRVQIIDTMERKTIGAFETASRPHGIKFSPDGKYALVGTMKGSNITIADANTFEVINRFQFEEGVRPFALTKDGALLYLQISNFHGFLEYDLTNRKLLKKISLPETDKSRSYNGNYPKHAAHHGIVLSADGSHLCIAGTSSNYVALVKRPELSLEDLIPVGDQPNWAINSRDGRYCYVSSRGSNTVSVISYQEKKELRRIEVGNYPQRMVVASLPKLSCSPNSASHDKTE